MDKIIQAHIIKKLNDNEKLNIVERNIQDHLDKLPDIVDKKLVDLFNDMGLEDAFEIFINELQDEHSVSFDEIKEAVDIEIKNISSELQESKKSLLQEYQKALLKMQEVKKGKDGKDGKDGVDGKNYVLTENDLEAIAKLVDVELPEIKEKTPDELKELLSLKIEDIEGLEEIIKRIDTGIRHEGTRGVTISRIGQMLDVKIEGISQGDIISWDESKGAFVIGGNIDSDGHVIQDEGVDLTSRKNLNFVGSNVEATDDAGNNATVVTIEENFSYETIPAGQTVTIPTNQQMIVHESITIDGTLVEDGELVLLGDGFWTIELVDALTVDFYAPYAMSIDSVFNVLNAPSITILDDGVAYTLGNTIAIGSKITVTADVASVVNLNQTKL